MLYYFEQENTVKSMMRRVSVIIVLASQSWWKSGTMLQ